MRFGFVILLFVSCYATVALAQCPSLIAPLFGNLSTSAVAVGTQVTVACESGFVIYGNSSVLTCLSSSQWNSPVPLCVVDCSNNNITDVDPFTGSTNGTIVARIDLTLTTHTGTIGGSPVSDTPAYQYFGKIRIPGPTIYMRAGSTCTVRIINKLSNPPSTSSDYGLCPYFANTVHCINTTNLHVHGLHVGPQEDNVGLAVSPGNYTDYVYHIPDDHHGGTFWYHPHYHGSIDNQVGVSAGAIIMDQKESVLATPTAWTNLYVDQRLLVFQVVNGTTNPTQSALSTYIVNGAINPTININANSWTLLRLVNAGGTHQLLSLFIVDSSGTCKMTLVARDGIAQYLPFVIPNHLVVPQGGRADVAVYCGTAAESVTVTVRSVYNSSHSAFLATGDVFAQTTVFTLGVQPAPYIVQSVPTVNRTLPDALKDISTASATAGTNISFSLTTGVSKVTFTGTGTTATYLNSVSYQLNTVYSYGLTADATNIFHPYHQHVNPVQLQSFTGATAVPEVSRIGEWRDVLPIHGGITANVKQRVVDYWGAQVLHCHIFAHEETGMMGLLQIATPSNITCSTAYTQTGYTVSGCAAGTLVNATCSATCASGYNGTVAGAVSCLQVSTYIARGYYSGSFSGCA